MRPAILLLLFAAFLTAQSTPAAADPSDAEKKKIRLEGSVVSSTGEPVRKANLRLQPNGPALNGPLQAYTESTDAEGKYVFEDVAPGRYTLNAEKAGFVTQRYGARTATGPGTIL